MATLSKATERRLRKLATPRGAAGYAAWLTANTPKTRKDERAAEAQDERRREPGYGLMGEAIYGGAAKNDGYAAYLQAAAKEARAARAEAREREDVSEGRRALAGYAAYLDGLRAEDADRLIAAGRSLLTLPKDGEARKTAIAAHSDDVRTGDALRALPGQSQKSDPTAEDKVDTHLSGVLNYIYTQGLDYDESYEYCRLLGYSDARAKAIAAYAYAQIDPAYDLAESIFKK